ncbi:uncharacterized protein [Asterias amurensis]|uniref:uncharacterized protein n=1 Tax=Asterias amurensis TaxID=7602 RepID=UPI003AB2C3A9
MESMNMVKQLIQKDDWMVSIDLKDAYFMIPIWSEDKKFLRFEWEDKIMEFQVLPFGLKIGSSTIHQNDIKPIISHLRQRSMKVIIYLDDLLLMSQSEEACQSQKQHILQLFEKLGLLVNWEKSQLIPCHKICFLACLGHMSDSCSMTLSLPEEKDPTYQSLVTLSETSIQELQWWAQCLRQWNGKPVRLPNPEITITSDTSTQGWGAHCGSTETGGRWSLTEKEHHINYLELLAAFLALQTFAVDRKNCHIMMRLDNSTAIAYIKHKGGTHTCTSSLSHLAIKMWKWCMQREIILTAYHVPGIDNCIADYQSRVFVDRLEWVLHPQIFAQLCRHLQYRPTIDLFASRLHHQIPRYVATRSRGSSGRHFLNELEERTSICISALLSLGTSVEEGRDGQNNNPCSSANMDDTDLVPHVTGISHNTTNPASSVGRQSNSTPFRPAPPIEQFPSSSGVAALRKQFTAKGFSQEVSQVMLDSCRPSTHKQYQSAWTTWCSWCDRRGLCDPVSAPITEIVEFLVTCEKDKGLSYRSLGVYKSAISMYHQPLEGKPVGQSADVCKLMKGFYNRNPPRPKYALTWEVDQVLQYIKTLPPNDSLSLKLLSLKTVLLLGLVTLGRVSSLVHIDIRDLCVSQSELRFIPTKLHKQNRPGNNIKSVIIESYEEKQICPVYAISKYLARTRALRGTETQLFISHMKPHKKVVSLTVSRWMVEMLSVSGIDTDRFKAHSTRGAAASCSHKLGVALRDILETAGWASNSTFSQFYQRPTATSVVAKAVLRGVTSKSPIDSSRKRTQYN